MTNYTINWSDNSLKTPFTVVGASFNSTTSLVLTGRDAVSWGESHNENFVRLLENFASLSTAPSNPTIGQLWFNATQNFLKVWFNSQWNDLSLRHIDSATTPTGSHVAGDLWYDTTDNVLNVYTNSDTWVPVYSQGGVQASVSNLTGGSAGTIPYQIAANTTAMLAAGTANYVLQANGAAAPSWVAAAPLAVSISGGSVGQVLYQSAVGVTSKLANGTTGQILQANTGAAPSWVSPAGGGTPVTSVNGQTGAVTILAVDPALYAIGGFIIGRPTGSVNYAPGAVVPGSSLYSTPPDTLWNDPANNWQYPGNQYLIGVGSWRCVSPARNLPDPIVEGVPSGAGPWGVPGLWVRYA